MIEDLDDNEVGSDIEPKGSEDVTNIKSSRRAFSKLATELRDDELSSPGVQKMLLAEIPRLETSETSASKYKDKYHESDKNCAILKEKGKTFTFAETLYSTCLAFGALLIGLIPSVNKSDFPPYTFGIMGGVLIFCALVAKVAKK